ncbi:ABC transporter ATP-binding protein [Xanthomonas dyei]|uniref:ABC transporter ATP-binding protein n=1 Tax=Xanthomonas dyei TaxID=743699 RepID=A0A2S7C6U7_9XANT|nr:ABC transporter ATP-binding protein [Xanthomonas dyei]PPU57272.1 ABC transporter ATP-binding protein [Xanthomonas dyei]
MSYDAAIVIDDVYKSYTVFDTPAHRLWQMLFRGKKKLFKEHRVIKGVSFSVGKGETVGLIGRNGAGKSTLLQIICGTLEPTAGNVSINGRVAALLELGAGFNPEFTGQENIFMSAQILGLTEDQIKERYESIIRFADIGAYLEQPVKTYSSGMFMRLAFSVIAHVDADILVIDEALAVGDAYFVQKCMRFLRNFTQNGGTLLFVSHDTTTVTSLCDRAVWIYDGKVRMDDKPKKVSQAYLADMYQSNEETDKVFDYSANSGETQYEDFQDVRRDFVVHSNLRNDISVAMFNPNSESFGKGGVRVKDVRIQGADGQSLMWMVGGESASLTIRFECMRSVCDMIVGFIVRNRQGLSIFGDNTYISHLGHDLNGDIGENWVARFDFRMPILPGGDYSISVAVSEGSQHDHIVHTWLHDALVLTSHSSSIATGLVGIPMRSIILERISTG